MKYSERGEDLAGGADELDAVADELGAVADETPVTLLEADAAAQGERLDRWVATRLPHVSRSRIQQWIVLGAVLVDGAPRAAKHKLGGFEQVSVRELPRAADSSFEPDAMELAVVHDDGVVAVLDKPAGLVTHPAPGNWRGTLMNGLLARWPAQAQLARAGIVHRLDKDTSGLIAIARSEAAARSLVAQLADRSMSRRYLALVDGIPPEAATVDAPIGRDPANPTRMAVVPHGRASRTHVRRLATGRTPEGRDVALVACKLDTGRTHQIRVHMKHLGHPLAGDAVYGRKGPWPIARQPLHAWQLGLVHPQTGQPVAFVAPPPPDLVEALAACGIDVDALHLAGPEPAGAGPGRAGAGLDRAGRA